MLVNERVKAFKPDFAEAYKILKNMRDLNLAEMKKAKCLEKAYAAGVRVAVQPVDKIDFATTGNPEVVVRGKTGSLFNPSIRKRSTASRVMRCKCAPVWPFPYSIRPNS